MKRSEDRILTTHDGSLIRPEELPPLQGANGTGTERWRDRSHDPETLHQAVADIVRKQAEIGLDIINDGEFGRAHFANYILERISGFEIRPDRLIPAEWLGRDRERFPEAIKQEFPFALEGSPAQVCVGPIKYGDHAMIRRDVGNLTDALKSVDDKEGFFTAVAPATTAFDGINEYYPSERDYVFAIADALREEYQEIHKAGLLVQVDDPVIANMYDALIQKSPQDYKTWANLRIEALNHALEGIPPDRVRYHVCYGSWHLPHVADAPLEEIVDYILQVNAGAYLIEAANVRHEHEWRVWDKVKLPQDKILVPGVITHHTTSVEHPQLVADRLVQFAKCVGRENVIAGTDCGFAQLDFVRRVHPSVMWAKFEALVEGARLATRELWGR
jgi:5-methyltetrahydropteroyltriglutamate--homocysteine methyltransferase